MRKNFYDQAYDREATSPSPSSGGSTASSSTDAATLGGIGPTGYMRIAGRGSLPTATADYNEMLWLTPYANGVAGGRLYICLRNDSGAYVWEMIVEGM